MVVLCRWWMEVMIRWMVSGNPDALSTLTLTVMTTSKLFRESHILSPADPTAQGVNLLSLFACGPMRLPGRLTAY